MKVKISEARYCQLLNLERLLKSKEAVEHKRCEAYKADAEKWRALVSSGIGCSEDYTVMTTAEYRTYMANAELGDLVARMPEAFNLSHHPDGHWFLIDGYGRGSGLCETPQEAFLRGPAVNKTRDNTAQETPAT